MFPLLVDSSLAHEFDGIIGDLLQNQGILDILEEVEDMYPALPMQEALAMSRSTNPELYLVDAIFKVSAPSGHDVDIDQLEGRLGSCGTAAFEPPDDIH